MAGAAISGGFGVVGGRIAARSMRNRTAPLQEFSFLPISETPVRASCREAVFPELRAPFVAPSLIIAFGVSSPEVLKIIQLGTPARV